MKKLFFYGFIFLILIQLFFSFINTKSCFAAVCSNADCSSFEECDKKIQECNGVIAAYTPAQTKNKEQLETLKKQIATIAKLIKLAELQVGKFEKEIFDREVDLNYQQEIFGVRVRSFYKRSQQFSPFLLLLSSENATELSRELSYRLKMANEDKRIILEISQELKKLQEDKEKIEKNKTSLAKTQEGVNKQAAFLEVEVNKVEDFLGEISSKIAELSTRQQEIINARSGGFIASIGDIELADDFNASIKGFRESAPVGYFGVFSFGAFTHRKGMSQYGARGRAQSGQNYKQILRAYYGKEPVNKDTGGDILVNGAAMNFEDKYLMGIAEMPSSWNMEALKAQAVAARTYAYRYKTQGTSICTTEKCQVFNSGKAASPPETWRQAVQSTRGEVLEDVVTFYASTHGGWASPIGWDTTNGSGGGNFIDNTYDKIGGSPWLYKAWYTQAYSVNSDKCGRSNAWLSPQEMADIVNAAIALKTEGIDTSRITPVTTSCWGGNPYSMDELRNLVSGKGGISSATSVSVSQGEGTTNSVTINGVNLSGLEFKKAFNLRAPGRLSIPQSGFAFYNIEKK
jgi:peptidoglycan hydrolase CwlO-like protein